MRNCGKKWSAGIGVLLLGVLGLLPLSVTAQSPTARDHFAAGTQAARQGNHSIALQQFNKALDAGMRSAALYYNIGVTCYRLGYLNQAASAFKQAVHSPKMTALAYYNLGLIARDRDNPSLASEYFEQAERAAQTEDLRKLSRHARKAMGLEKTVQQDQLTMDKPNEPDKERGMLWIEFNSGYDDNVLLVQSEESSSASGEADTFAGTMLFGHYYTAGNRQRGLRLYGLILLDRHSDLDGFDLDITGTGADYSVTINQWRHNLDLMLLQSRLGGDELEDTGRLVLSSKTLLTKELELKLQLGYESINAASAYVFLDGQRQKAVITLSALPQDWELKYNLEDNDRKDYLAEDGRFQSFSPRRQGIVLTKHVRLGRIWKLELEGAYIQSRYPDANIQPDGLQQKRQDKRTSLGIGLYRTWIYDWRLGMELGYTENESNLDDFDYTRHALTLTLDKAFRF